LTAQLAGVRQAPGVLHDGAKASMWLRDAGGAFRRLQHGGLVNVRAGTVHDKLGPDCAAQDARLTYTEGEVADALIQLGSATRSDGYYSEARAFVDYAISPQSGMTSAGGVLQERCETGPQRCHGGGEFNTASFKGIFVQAVSDYDQATAASTLSRLSAGAGAGDPATQHLRRAGHPRAL
jgi:hypothetical protein